MIGPIGILGVVLILALVTIWCVKREWTQYVLGASVAFPQTAGIVVAGNGVPVFYLAILTLALLTAPQILLAIARPDARHGLVGRGQFIPDLIGVILVVWAAAITLLGPRLFAGMPVFSPTSSLDEQANVMLALAPNLGNIAQLGYLGLAVVFLILAGRAFRLDGGIVFAAVWVAVVLGGARLALYYLAPSALPIVSFVLETTPGLNYQTNTDRLAGTFYEPSVMGMLLVAALGMFASQLVRLGPARGWFALVGLALVAVEIVFNRSGTAIGGVAVVIATGVLLWFFDSVRRGQLIVKEWAVVGGLVLITVAITQLTRIVELISAEIFDKVDSNSFLARNASNTRAVEIIGETFGLGVGLGGNRPSSFALFVPSTLGVIGAVMLASLLVLAAHSAARHREGRPIFWALAGTVAGAIVAVPDLSNPLLWACVAACLSYAIRDGRLRRSSSARPDLLMHDHRSRIPDAALTHPLTRQSAAPLLIPIK